jgi:hypothetical protein
MNCQKENCTNQARFQVRMSLAVNASHAPAVSQPILFLCNEHKDFFKKENFFDEPGQWDGICRGFQSAGRPVPKKEFSKIIIEPIPQLN